MPRQILPGSTYLISRRCTQRESWLQPGLITNAIVLFCLAVAAKAYQIELHAYCVLGNHWHLVVTDPSGQLPEFLRWVHQFIARCINEHERRCENVWSSDPCSVVRLEDRATIVNKMAYTMTNPVRHGLVRKGRKWPGLRSSPKDFLKKPRAVAKPPVYFRQGGGALPDVVELHVTKPPGFQHLTDGEFRHVLAEETARQEETYRAKAKLEGRGFMTPRQVLRLPMGCRPQPEEPQLRARPCFAASDPAAWKAARDRLRAFRKAYREARMRWKEGEREELFPPGTYWLRIHAGVACCSWTTA